MGSKINRQQLVLEFISVVFAVLLALFLNSWRENSATKNAVEKVQKTVLQEILKNDKLIREANSYHKKLITDLYNDRHLFFMIPMASIDVNYNNDAQVKAFFTQLALGSSIVGPVDVFRYDDEIMVSMGNIVLRAVNENDTLKTFGKGNIQLRSADIGNRSWELAQATGTLVEMDLELVDALSALHTLNQNYLSVSDKAIEMVYRGDQGITAVIEDMSNIEEKIIKADSVLIGMLE